MNFENILIKKTTTLETQKVQPLEDNYSTNKTLRERMLELSSLCTDLIKKRNLKKAFSNVLKHEKGESQNFRTLRQVESMFQNSVLRTVIGRDRFFRSEEIPANKVELINIAATQMYKELGDEIYAYQESEKISRGINAVYRYVVRAMREYSDTSYFIGTNDYIDAAREIDLIVSHNDVLDLVQVKNKEMELADIESIHQTHQEFIDDSRKYAMEHIHVLVENYTKNLDNIENIDIEVYSNFINQLDEIHSFLEWLKPLYDEKIEKEEDYSIDNEFLNEVSEIAEVSDQDFSQMAIFFQKGDILHDIFMMNTGRYSFLYNKITQDNENISKKENQRLTNEGILSFLYDDDFLRKITEKSLDTTEQKELNEYLMLMRSLDRWSVDYIENMNLKDSQEVFKKMNKLIGIEDAFIIQNSKSIQSVVAHGDKVHKKLLT